MNFNDYSKALLALVIWREASGEGPEGMQAVGCVVRNRAAKAGGDYSAVITKKWQFSSMTAPGDGALIRWPAATDKAFETARDIADHIYDGTLPDITGGATSYRNPVTATSESFQKAVDSGELVMTRQIGHHVFYK